MTALATSNCSASTGFSTVSGHNAGTFDGTYRSSFASGHCAVYESAYGSWPDDQYSQAKASTVATDAGQGAGPLCRHTTGQYYYVKCTTTETQLRKFVSGFRTTIGTGTAVATNSVVKLECIGTALKVYDDGVEIISVTDASLTGGQPGMYTTAGSSPYGALDDWEGGDTAAGGSTLPLPAWHDDSPVVLFQ